jgi:prepilin-type N-terminal cleavage/methylation domain-containing protein
MKWNMAQREARGFTLIELLIVVAIIAILAAIAVPNFLEAQVRSKVARSKADMRTQAIALEAYFLDYNTYTRDSDSSMDTQGQVTGKAFGEYANGAICLTTPIAYMSGILNDPFVRGVAAVGGGMGAIGYRIASGSWSYQSTGFSDNQQSYEVFKQMGPRACYAVIGVGPDGARCRMGYKCFPFMPASDSAEGPVGEALHASKGQPCQWTSYDPSNGTGSLGDIYQFGGEVQSGRFMLDGKVVGSGAQIGGAAW